MSPSSAWSCGLSANAAADYTMPLVAGWLSDRIGRKPLIIGVYLGGAIAFVVFLAAGTSMFWLWVGIVLMGLFTFAESRSSRRCSATSRRRRPATPRTRSTSPWRSGSCHWRAVYGAVIKSVR